MTRLLPCTTALLLLVTAGLAHGVLSERWRPSAVLDDAAGRVERVPMAVGDWDGKGVEVDSDAFAQAGARTYWARSYTNRRTGATVQVILMCGRPGKMAVHTPEICYRGAGFDLMQAPTQSVLRDEMGAEQGVFWNARFAKQAGAAGDLRLYWAWGTGAVWQAPSNPRWEFRGQGYLYKLYASHELNIPDAPDSTAELLRELLPVLKEVLPAKG